jgi:hypothetical protein
MGDDNSDLNVLRVNETFYAADPSDYLLTRWQLLMLAGGRRQDLARLFAQGVEFAGMEIGPQDSDTPSETGELSLDPFLTIESQMLLHHSAETTLRLFLAHISAGPVPWSAMNSNRNFADLKKSVKSQFVDSQPESAIVSHVCLGRQTPPDEISEEDWRAAIEGITSFLSVFAQRFLNDSGIYNAIKHGLGVRAAAASVFLGGQQFGGGASVDFVESDSWNNGERTWSLTTQWVDLGETLGLVRVATQIIDSIWHVGRFRHLGTRPSKPVFFPTALRPNQLRNPSSSPMKRMSWEVAFEKR